MKKKKILLFVGALLLALPSPSPADLTFSYAATDLPKPIYDLGTTQSVINVSDHGIITDLNVFLSLSHGWLSDVVISVAHGATSVWLCYRENGAGSGITATFDDSAGTSINNSFPPFNGTYRPTTKAAPNLLSAFNGQDLFGAWTLTVADTTRGDGGMLYNFGINGTVPVPLPPSVWLFGSGLMGLIGWRRFRRS